MSNKMTSFNRYLKGTFKDEFKHKILNLIANNQTKTATQVFTETSKERITNFSVYCTTWNVAGAKLITKNIDLTELISPDGRQYDIIAIGLQEIVDLNATNILMNKNSESVEFWNEMFAKAIRNLGVYKQLIQLDLVGIYFVVFIKEELVNFVSNIDSIILRKGFYGTLGNKGSCIVRFELLGQSFAFASGHFAAGQDEADTRIKELAEVIDCPLKSRPGKETLFKDHNFAFILGDLNFRIDLDNYTCRYMVREKKYEDLQKQDQLRKAMKVYPFLRELKEGELDFDPTFKYDQFSDLYDTSKKSRVPSWTDRVMWIKNSRIWLEKYGRLEYIQSDHRPVFAIFDVGDKKRIEKKKEEIVELFKKTSLEIKENDAKGCLINR